MKMVGNLVRVSCIFLVELPGIELVTRGFVLKS
jgi:hypothetical protein